MPRPKMFGALRAALALESKQVSLGRSYSLSPRSGSIYGRNDRAAGWDIETVVDGYERSVWVFNCVEAIAGNQARLPFIIGNADSRVENHPLLRVMNKQANPMETGRSFRKRLSMQVLLSKRGAFVEVTKSRAGRIVRLDLLDPSRTIPVPSLDGDYVAYFEHTRPDGAVIQLDPSKVRWIREPHPIDPYSGVTPLEAAGMSIELDQLARLYNVTFIQRDGRPGGILGIDAQGISDDELVRIAQRLRAGPDYAGQIAAIGTGKGGMNYIDTAAKPRDMSYETTSDKSRKEILAAFKVPESKAGDASNRTYDNADQEDYNFWQDPMLPHCDLLSSAFDGDVDDDLDCGHDFSQVEALELPARKRREERRQEFNAGLINIREYRDPAGYDDVNNAHTRALWISPTKAPVATDPADRAELGMLGDDSNTPGAPGAEGADPASDAGEQPAGDLVAGELAAGAQTGAPEVDPESAAAAVAAASTDQADDQDDAAMMVAAARMESKSLESSGGGAPTTDAGEHEVSDEALARLEMTVGAALEALLARQAGFVATRIASPQFRAGTPYWTPSSENDPKAGAAPVNVEKVVDPARWEGELQETLRPIVQSAAQESGAGLLSALATAGLLTVPAVAGVVIAGASGAGAAAGAADIARVAAKAVGAPMMFALVTAVTAYRDWMNERIAAVDAALVDRQIATPEELSEVVRAEWSARSKPFADGMAVSTAQATVLGSTEAVAAALTPNPNAPDDAQAKPQRAWVTRHDEKVRASHRAADGQVRMVGEPFEVGGYSVRWPCDPLAPPSVSRNCRCWLRYMWPAGASYVVPAAE